MVHKSRTQDDYLHLGAKGKQFTDARFMRKNPTKPEQVLWNALKNSQLKGYKFRRQHPLDQFIVDFYCHEAKLVVEVDGGYHETSEQKEKDEGRTFELEKFGIRTVRFSNDEVLNDLKSVLDCIEGHLNG